MSAAAGPAYIRGFRIKKFDKSRGVPIFTKNMTEKLHHYNAPISEETWKAAKVYFMSNILTNEEILRGGPGIYTWILKADNFYTTKVTTPQEIGTLHFLLDELKKVKSGRFIEPVVLAGELQVNDDSSIVFNLLSGSYTLPIIRGLNELDLKGLSAYARDQIIKKIRELSKNSEYTDLSKPLKDGMLGTIASSIEQMMVEKFRTNVMYNEQPLIDGANIRTSMNDIARFNSFLTKKPNQGGTRKTRSVLRKTRKSRK